MITRGIFVVGFIASLGMVLSGSAFAEKKLSGTVKIDGSSTVYPLSEAVAEEFLKKHRRVRVTVGVSGTGGGFKKFSAGETDVSDASRPIKDKEAKKAAGNKIEFIELPVAYDGIAVVVNKNNPVNNISKDELKVMWGQAKKPKTWNQVSSKFPKGELKLYGPGPENGTFDYFTEAVLGKKGKPRPDYTQSEDDNVLVRGISGDKNAVGYFGFSYYMENKDKIKALKVDGIEPTATTIESGTYPLSRPIFIYVSKNSLQRPEVQEFVQFYMENASSLAAQVGMVPLSEKLYAAARKRLQQQVTGTVYTSSDKKKMGLAKLYNLVN